MRARRMKIKSDDTNIFENDKNSIYSKIMDFTFSIKHYFLYICACILYYPLVFII